VHAWQQRSGTVTLPGTATTVRAELFDYMTDGWVAMDDVSLTGATVTKYYYLGSQRVARRQGGVLTYLHGDHLGSASLATDVSGAKVSEQRYLPYGGTRSGSMPTDRQYTGQRNESGLGFYDFVARQFDPTLGRFLQADTIVPNPANPQSLNRYSYTLGNPLRYTDPSGHYSEEEIMQAFGVSTWEEVLAFFQVGGGLLENRWGWLEILRRGQDGDSILSNPWEVVGHLYQKEAYRLHRNSEGKISVGDIDHAYFANHQTRYTLFSPRLSIPYSTEYSEMHLHFAFEHYEPTNVDKQTATMDFISILLECGGALGWIVHPAITGVAELAQAGLDTMGYYGAGESLERIAHYRDNAGFTSDDILGVIGAIPVAGMITDLADLASHSTGWRGRWTP